jgi:hypothetical protein
MPPRKSAQLVRKCTQMGRISVQPARHVALTQPQLAAKLPPTYHVPPESAGRRNEEIEL